MQETGVRTLFESKFECPACGTLSRIPESVPTETVFRLTCYRCGHKALVRLANRTPVRNPEPIRVFAPTQEPTAPVDEPTKNFSNSYGSKAESPRASLGSRLAESLNGKIASFREDGKDLPNRVHGSKRFEHGNKRTMLIRFALRSKR